MAEQKSVDKYSRNQFVLFYTLRYLWKLNGSHTVGELYKAVFPSRNEIGGNKTLYNHILGLQVSYEVMLSHSTRLAELTGLSKDYFTGKYALLIPPLLDDDWNRFIQLRKKSAGMKRTAETKKGTELKQIEVKIKRAIRDAKDNQAGQSEPLKRLIYFAEYGHKRADKTLEDLFGEIESKIAECHPNDFEKAGLELLEKHQNAVQEHLYHIAAVITVRKWKKSREEEQ